LTNYVDRKPSVFAHIGEAMADHIAEAIVITPQTGRPIQLLVDEAESA
jgi:hypothetical protein